MSLLTVAQAFYAVGQSLSSMADEAKTAAREVGKLNTAREAAGETTSTKNRVSPDGPTMGATSGSSGSGSGKNAVTPSGLAAAMKSTQGRGAT